MTEDKKQPVYTPEWISGVLAQRIGPLVLKGLSPREAEVMALTYEGLNNKAISMVLSDINGVRISESAVCNYRRSGRMKLVYLYERGELGNRDKDEDEEDE